MSEHRRAGFVLAAAVGVVGVTFGVFADAAELSAWQAMAMSAFVFTGASQFAAVGVIDTGGEPSAAVASAMLLSLRNLLYGPLVSRWLPSAPVGRAIGAHFVIDETTAMATAQPDDPTSRDAFWFTGIWLFSLWNAGTLAGLGLGSVIGDPEAYGLDAAFPAAFVALLAPHVETAPGRIAAVAGATIALVALPLVPAGLPLVLSALGVVPAVVWKRRHG